MAPGEEHLAGLIADDSPSVRPAKSGQRRFRTKGKKNPIAQKDIPKDEIPSNSSSKAKNKRNKAAGRNRPISSSSPKTAVLGLIASGFFSKPRTGPKVQEFLKTKKGFNFGIAQVRLVMLRLVRDDKLDRNQNAEGHTSTPAPNLSLDAALSTIPKSLRNRLIKNYSTLKSSALEEQHDSLGHQSGKLAEVLLRIAQHILTGSYTPLNQNIGNFGAECHRLEQTPKIAGPEGLRIILPRALELV